MKLIRKTFDKVSKIYPALGNIGEDDLAGIKEVFNGYKLHRETVFSYLFFADSGRLLLSFSIKFKTLPVAFCSLPDYLLYWLNKAGLAFFKRTALNPSDAHPLFCFHNDHIACFEFQIINIKIVYLACLFKSYANHCCHYLILHKY